MFWRKLLNPQIAECAFGKKNHGSSPGGVKNFRAPERFVIKTSSTRGVPSTSTDLKEAVCEKIPIHYDLLREFREQEGSTVVSQITVKDLYEGLSGVCTMVRETSENDPKYGVRYRGLTIPEVMTLLPRNGNFPSPEAVFWLLLTGDVPTHDQTSSLIADWTKRRRKRREWWCGSGCLVGTILRALPESLSPLKRLSVALAALDADKHMKEAYKTGAMSHTHWEYTYEDGMELLAVLPAIVGLVAKNQQFGDVTEDGDWISFLLDRLGNVSKGFESKRRSIGDFLRLYVALNADEDGGVPGAHVADILGTCKIDANQALAASVLAYANEPTTGTMAQCMDFQTTLQSVLGRTPKQKILTNFVETLVEQGTSLVGHKESPLCDPRYDAILEHVKKNIPEYPEIKLSHDITRAFTTTAKRIKGKNICPQQSTIAAPVFQFYGLEDMEFNQTLLCMSRALGMVASIIWSRAINMPAQQPKSLSTYTYFNMAKSIKGKPKHGRSKRKNVNK